MLIKVAICNFQDNGAGNRALWQGMHERLKSLGLHLLLRQEMWGAEENAGALATAAERVLGLTGIIGEGCCTALYYSPDLFTPVENYTPITGPMWVLPPTVRGLRLRGTTPSAVPLLVSSFHLNYSSPATRLPEAERLTQWADRWDRSANRAGTVHWPALIGGDTNSYPTPGTPGDPALPVLDQIADEPHRAHRSYLGPDGVRRMDDRPDATLRTAGLHDVARHLATTRGDTAALAPTMDACSTHGPDARVDRLYASPELLPALRTVEVIDMHDLSDHHTVVATFDQKTLTHILNNPLTRTA
ncbi:endonuclease/exonuclease/phosphatase family protein [Streptomyces sp. NPDC001255]|uniref:endonuclease/exonuclease/phosphatase family protein n=1 Tax=Streptomyces sp. NPDC001255 TaxID=3364550 RepID=UPI0036C26E4A